MSGRCEFTFTVLLRRYAVLSDFIPAARSDAPFLIPNLLESSPCDALFQLINASSHCSFILGSHAVRSDLLFYIRSTTELLSAIKAFTMPRSLIQAWEEDINSKSICKCDRQCCYFDGCCTVNPTGNRDAAPYVEPYAPVKIIFAEPQSQHTGISFLDLSDELRNWADVLTVLNTGATRLRLNPTIMDHGEEYTWGGQNHFAILAVCRQIYHEASPLAYGENIYEIFRGHHHIYRIPKNPGIPYTQF